MPAVKAVSKKVGASHKRLMPLLDLVRGKKVAEAVAVLEFMPSPWARIVAKTIQSAAANAENNLLMDRESLRVVRITADQAESMRRFKPHARGRVGRMNRRFSHLTVVVDQEAS
ncbi:MAG: 50S ribosomal protein L22 [SAR202 cluster bacterium]|nr:50S ribosomal protein L22 [SAR202 cluster bacterium]